MTDDEIERLREECDALKIRLGTYYAGNANGGVVKQLEAERDRLRGALADMERERDSARHERDVLVVTEEAHRALDDKAQMYFAALVALVEHLQPGRSLTEMARWDAPWPQVAEALRR